MRTRLSLTNTLLAVCASASLLSCGDNLTPGNGGVDAPDVTDPDASPDAPPDGMQAPTVGGTLAVFDATVVDPETAAAGGVGGGTIRFSFNDFTMNGGETIFGTSAIGGCVITKFDATHVPNPRLNAGQITVTGPATGASALNKTVGPCTLQAALGDPDPYACVSAAGTAAAINGIDMNSLSAGAGLVAYIMPGTPNFGMTTPVTIAAAVRNPAGTAVTVTTLTPHGITLAGAGATWVTIAGMTPASFNTGAPFNAAPVAAVLSPTMFVYGQAGTADEAATGFGTASGTTNRMIGSALVVNGLTDTTYNSGASAFPVLGQINNNTLLVRNPGPADGSNSAAASGSFTVLNGFTPIPGAGDGRANFLLGSAAPNETSSIRIQKAANDVWPAIDVTIDVPGEPRRPVAVTLTRLNNVATATTTAPHDFLVGQSITVAGASDPDFNGTGKVITAVTAMTFTYANTGADLAVGVGGTAVKPGGFALDGTSASLTAFPTTGTAAAVKYSCDNGTVGANNLFDDTCGDESTAILKAFIISGSATKKPLTGLFPFQMPTEIPGTDEWLEWQCAFIGAKSGTMPAGAVQAIMDFEPTRVEQQVLFVGGTILDGDGPNVQTLRVLAGHALAGHTTFPAP